MKKHKGRFERWEESKGKGKVCAVVIICGSDDLIMLYLCESECTPFKLLDISGH